MGTTDLEKRISNAQGPDKVDILLEASTNREESPATSLEYALMGIRLAKEIGYEKGMAHGLQRAGNISINLGDVDSGIKNLLSSLEHYDKANDKDGMGESLLLLGKVYLQKEDTSRSAEYFNWSASEFNKAGDLPGEAAAANNCGFVYKVIGEYDKALESYDNALSIYRRLKDKHNEAVLLSNIAKLYFDKKDYLEAIEFYEEAVSVLPEAYRLDKSELLYGLAMAYSKGNDHKRAISSLEESRDIKITLEDEKGINKVEKALLLQEATIMGGHRLGKYAENEELEKIENDNVSGSNLSTDIKNYLTAIIGNAQHLKEHHEELSGDEIQDLISDIETSAFNIDNAVNSFAGYKTIDFEQEQPGLEDVDLNEVINEALETHNESLESKGVGLVKQHAEKRHLVRANKEVLKGVLKHVVSNAIAETPAGKNIYSYLTAEDGKIRCEIIDEGTGQGSRSLLTSLQDLAKKMGGTLTYESMVGGGGTFVLIFNEAKN